MDVAVEDVAGDQQQDVLRAMAEPPVQRDDDEEKDDELEAVKDHGNSGRRRL